MLEKAWHVSNRIANATCTGKQGTPLAKQVKRWPIDLAVPGSRPAEDGNLFSRERGYIAHSLSLSNPNRHDITAILLKRM